MTQQINRPPKANMSRPAFAMPEATIPDPPTPEAPKPTDAPTRPAPRFTVHAMLDDFPFEVEFSGTADNLSATVKRLREIGDEVRRAFEAAIQPHHPGWIGPIHRVHQDRHGQTLVPAPTDANLENVERFDKPLHLRHLLEFGLEREQTRRPGHLFFDQRPLRMVGIAGVKHPLDLRTRFKEFKNRVPRFLGPRHAHR